MEQLLTEQEAATAFNEWMERFTKDPQRFQREFECAGIYLAEKNAGRTPTYGETAAAYLFSIANDRPDARDVRPTPPGVDG